ncbi:WD repeat-containing protein 86 [Dermatophagoides pteronyssinus]|uniref:WD repeat-containing protein 86 n=1 Tax=Dermatophagoides pteronyssinus TaxID=6956 RepID=A0ABQ8JRY4_DERPT|nr:WD repeat-containing protein 86 [Dermatophagoides pteronyssinus]
MKSAPTTIIIDKQPISSSSSMLIDQRSSTAPPILETTTINQSQLIIKDLIQSNDSDHDSKTSMIIGNNQTLIDNDDSPNENQNDDDDDIHSSLPEINNNDEIDLMDKNIDELSIEHHRTSTPKPPIKIIKSSKLNSRIDSILSTSTTIFTDRFESLLRRTSFISTRILNPKTLVNGINNNNLLLQQEINDHRSGVNCLALSEDLSLLVSGGEDGIVRLWSTFSTPCELIGILSGHQNYITCCTVHRYLIISGSADCTLKIWLIESGNCIMTLYGHDAFINRCLTYGPILISTSFDNTVRVWSLTNELTIVQSENQFDRNSIDNESRDLLQRIKIATTFGQCLYTLQDHEKSIIQELDIIITTSTDGRAITYSLATGELRHILDGHKGPINCLAIDGKESSFIYTAGADSVIKNWDVITGEFIRDLSGHEGSILCLLAHKRILYSGSTDRTVRAWAMEFGQCTRVYYQNTAPVSCLQYFKGILYTGCNDNCARLYDANSAVLMQTFAGHSGLITALQVVPGKLFTSSYDGRILVWNCEELQQKLLDTTKKSQQNNQQTSSTLFGNNNNHSMLSEQLRSIVLDSAKTTFLSYYCCWTNFLRFITEHHCLPSKSSIKSESLNYKTNSNSMNNQRRKQHHHQQQQHQRQQQRQIINNFQFNWYNDNNDQKFDDSANVRRAINAIEPYLRSFK